MNKDFTLIIPTHNRHNYLQRILEFYKNALFKIKIFDSSNKKYLNKIPSHIEYFYCPNLSFVEKIAYALKKVSTKYVLLCADDDFTLTSAINEACNFLDLNTDYSSVCGKQLTYILYNDNNIEYYHKSIYQIEPNKKQESTNNLIRLENLFNPFYQTFYALHRTKSLCKIYEQITTFNIKESYLCEFAQSIFTILDGKIKELDSLFQIREVLNNSLSKQEHSIPFLYKNNHPEIKNFKNLFFSNNKLKYLPLEKKEEIFKSLFLNFDSFINVWNNPHSSKVHTISLCNKNLETIDLLNNLYKNHKELKEAENLIFKYRISSGFEFYTQKNYKQKFNNSLNTFTYNITEIFNTYDKIVLYGAGSTAKTILSLFKHKVKYIVDKNKELEFTSLESKVIYSIDQLIKDQDYEKIIITVLGREEEIIYELKNTYNIKKEIIEIKV